MAAGLVQRGARVTVFCAAHAAAPPDEVVDGIRFVRRGSKLTVYLRGMWRWRGAGFGPVDLVVDVQNGLPFFSRAGHPGAGGRARAPRAPRAVAGRLPRAPWPRWAGGSSAAWLRGSTATASTSRSPAPPAGELRPLGVRGPRVAVVHNGTDPVVHVDAGKAPTRPSRWSAASCRTSRSSTPSTPCCRCRRSCPGLRLHVVGSGWWEAELHPYAAARGAGDAVVFEGHVDEERKHEVYERAWLLLLPSLKEGWGLVIGEAGMHATPAVAYRSAGGTRESIADGRSGRARRRPRGLHRGDRASCCATRRGAPTSASGRSGMSHDFTWPHAQQAFAQWWPRPCRASSSTARTPRSSRTSCKLRRHPGVTPESRSCESERSAARAVVDDRLAHVDRGLAGASSLRRR